MIYTLTGCCGLVGSVLVGPRLYLYEKRIPAKRLVNGENIDGYSGETSASISVKESISFSSGHTKNIIDSI